jgi:lipopolysaccharide assembly protein A
MRLVTWTIRLALFLLLLVFAVWNTEPVTLRFWFGQAWQAPLVFVLLAFFVAGALFGIAAVLGTTLRQRREIGRLRREARVQAQ